jgi:hypothetical protein
MPTEKSRKTMYVLSLIFLGIWVATEIFDAYDRRKKWEVLSSYVFSGSKEVTLEDKIDINNRVCTLERLHGIECSMSTELDWRGRRKK